MHIQIHDGAWLHMRSWALQPIEGRGISFGMGTPIGYHASFRMVPHPHRDQPTIAYRIGGILPGLAN